MTILAIALAASSLFAAILAVLLWHTRGALADAVEQAGSYQQELGDYEKDCQAMGDLYDRMKKQNVQLTAERDREVWAKLQG